jgi:hypothetical protein
MAPSTFVSSYRSRRPLAIATAVLLTAQSALRILVELDATSAADSRLVAGAGLVTSLATPLAFLLWLAGVYRNLPALGSRTTLTAAWAVGRWFVPVVNLWHGYVALRTAWIESHPEAEAAEAAEDRRTRLVAWWWALFLLSVARFAVGRIELLALPRLSLEILAAGLCALMVLEIDARQRERHQELVAAARVDARPAPQPTPWPSLPPSRSPSPSPPRR